MAGRDRKRGRDLDDWFAEPEPSPPRRGRRLERTSDGESPTLERGRAGSTDDWVASSDTASGRKSRFGVGRPLSDARLAGLAVAALAVVLLIGLAAAGVFSGGSHQLTTAATTARQAAPAPSARPPARPVRAPATTLKPGDSGVQVKVLQRALASLGYSPGSIDGQYGPATQGAVSRLQHASGLTADGILGPQTLRALTRTLRNAKP